MGICHMCDWEGTETDKGYHNGCSRITACYWMHDESWEHMKALGHEAVVSILQFKDGGVVVVRSHLDYTDELHERTFSGALVGYKFHTMEL